MIVIKKLGLSKFVGISGASARSAPQALRGLLKAGASAVSRSDRVRGRELRKSDLESDFLRIRKRKSMKSECQKCWKQKSAINDERNGKEMRKLRILFQIVTIGEFYEKRLKKLDKVVRL